MLSVCLITGEDDLDHLADAVCQISPLQTYSPLPLTFQTVLFGIKSLCAVLTSEWGAMCLLDNF